MANCIELVQIPRPIGQIANKELGNWSPQEITRYQNELFKKMREWQCGIYEFKNYVVHIKKSNGKTRQIEISDVANGILAKYPKPSTTPPKRISWWDRLEAAFPPTHPIGVPPHLLVYL